MSKQWKAVTIDWDALALQDDDDQCTICISTREAAILKALLITAYWPTRWDNLGDTPKVLKERMARLDNRLDVCADVGGESWLTILALNALFKALFERLWDGSPTDINPDAPTGIWNTGDTDDRNAALCMAAMALVDTIAAMEQQALAWRYAGTRLIFAVLKILIPGFAAWGVLVLGELLGELTYEIAMAALDDRQARLDVACCMLAALKGEAVTEEVLSESLDGCGFTPGTNEAIVRDYVYESIQSTDTYYAMIDAAGRAFVQVSVLGINLCECGDCGYCGFDEPLYDMAYTIEYGVLDIGGNPANCLHASEWTVPEYDHGRKVRAKFTLPAESTIAKVAWDFYHVNDSYPAGELAMLIYLYDDGDVLLDTWADTIETEKNKWEYHSDTGSQATVSYIIIEMHFVCDCPLTREIRMDNVRVFCA